MNSRTPQVIFCGENPELRLVKPDDVETEIAFASYWHCTYSPQGVGQMLALHIAANILANLPDGLTLLLANNPALGRVLADDLIRHFPGVGHIPFQATPVEVASLAQSGDGQTLYYVTVRSESYQIEVHWENMLDVRLPGTYAGFIQEAERGTVLDVSNVICPVGGGSIFINRVPVQGKVYSFQDGTMPRSTAFLAFSETWVRREAR